MDTNQVKQNKKNKRALALDALEKIHQQDAYANIVLSQLIKEEHLQDVDRRFVTELVYGVVRRYNYLNAIIEFFTKKPIGKLKPVIAEILRLGIYQLLYLDKVPESAAVNESVKLAKKRAKGLDRLVNAILRNVIRQREDIAIDHLAKTVEQRLAFLYNQPEWLIRRWIAEFGQETTEELCAWFNEKPVLTARVNTLKTSKEACLAAMKEAGWDVEESTRISEAIHIYRHIGALETSSFVKDGWITFMDEASMLVSYVLAPKPGDKILDCCAAPGGKTMHMATKMENRGILIAGDIHPHKLGLMEDNATRLGVDIVSTQVRDGREIREEDKEAFDRVLVDAPCSGLGILQKKLDMRWHKKEEDIEQLPDLQVEILEAASEAVKPGGVLVYSTCTINKKENEGVVERFLASHPTFKLEDASPYIPFSVKGPMITLLPNTYDMDGFFMARMRKESHD